MNNNFGLCQVSQRELNINLILLILVLNKINWLQNDV